MVSVVMVPSRVHVEMWLGQVRMSLILNYLPFWKNKNFSLFWTYPFGLKFSSLEWMKKKDGDVMVRMTS